MILYKTVVNEGKAEQEIDKSKFICTVKPVNNKEEADDFFSQIRKQYKDATHNVPCMVIGDKMQIQWASDDGEPQGTSGAPMVQMLVSEGITNVALVVTRYFGGIKLGTGGLVRAYTSSAKLGLEAAHIGYMRELLEIEFEIDYTFLSSIQYMSEKSGMFKIEDIRYADKAVVSFLTESENAENLMDRMAENTHGTAVKKKSKIIKKVFDIEHML